MSTSVLSKCVFGIILCAASQASATWYTQVPLSGHCSTSNLGGLQSCTSATTYAPDGNVCVSTGTATGTISYYWENDFTLAGHALRVNHKDYQAYNILGLAEANKGDYEKAIYHQYMALQYNPDFYPAYNFAGNVFMKAGRLDDAINCYKKALRISANYVDANCNLGIALIEKKRFNEAIFYLKKALEILPDDYSIHNNLGFALMKTGSIEEALTHLREALRLNPRGQEAQENMKSAIDAYNKLK